MSSDFYGSGWSFPPKFNKETKSVEMVSKEDDIRQSLAIILGTRVGERFLQPKFGCNLADYQFQSLDVVLQLHIKSLVSEAIEKFEPRVYLENVKLNTEDILDGCLKLEITYIIKDTNSVENLVYPYYLENN